ncbi:D-alanyl-D-alanine carboxypeptidase [Coxiella endosymbiont of Ornithodoros amblus]|uniref:D-alanyl-D-alanine carboxypeptidase family protein n=1 Tax=Coxiella endosymbiont of Ornithodoros amblus TaxID=1656166 RepID=UPI00244DCD13|nr:D-alanyl-D-alanine carboxypeptidase family protein [Coxiella endosymbiont of Ornithodoros amblus]MBW5802836.1 D-alanyl-D-alanine carboxypeptidase [Coxiella endosymbiont of Ornithodoros amblus]
MKFLHSWLQAICILAILLLFSVEFSVSALGDIENPAQQNLVLEKAATQQQPETPPSLLPPPPNLDVKGYVLMDADSGIIIAQKNMTQRPQPASLTKLMTLYVIFQELRSAQIHLDDKAKVSVKAWRTGGSRMFLKEGTEVPVNLLIQGIIVPSGNDACVTMSQYIGGTESSFAQVMNQTAERLGMKNSHYVDSTGLPHQNHYSTPYDMAVLTRAIINDFPEYYHYFSQKWLTYNNIKQPNRNRLLWSDRSVDGLKTGHTEKAGYCLIASAKRNNMRLISVVMGAPTDSERADDSEALLNYGFRFYQTRLLFDANTSITKKYIWMGKQKHVEFGLTQPLYVTYPVGEDKNLKVTISFAIQHLHAPILKGQSYGKINVILNGKSIKKVPLIALQDDPHAGLFSRAFDHITLFFHGIFTKSS